MLNQSRYIAFLRDLTSQLEALSPLLGAEGPTLRTSLVKLLKQVLRETEPDRFVALTHGVYRLFAGTAAEQAVRVLFNQTVGSDPAPSQPRSATRGPAVVAGVKAADAATRASFQGDLANALEALVQGPRKVSEAQGRGEQQGKGIAKQAEGRATRGTTRGMAPPTLEALAPAAAPAAPTAPAPETFHFVLRGAAARGNSLLKGGRAKLIFNYAVPPADALLSDDHPALQQARAASLDLQLLVTGSGAVQVLGRALGRACFTQGRLLEPVSFELQAADTPGEATLHIEYLVRGELVHQTEIPLQVVEKLAPAGAGTRVEAPLAGALADLAASASPAPAQRITLSLSYAANLLRISLADYRGGELEFQQEYQSTLFDPTRVQALIKGIHGDLQGAYADEDVWARFTGSLPAGEEGGFVAGALAETLHCVAVAGSRLNEDLHEDTEIAQALDYIEAQGEPGAVLSITTDNTFLPWELLTPQHRSAHMDDEEKQAEPVERERFWGARFAIETEKRGIGSLTWLRDEHLRRPPSVTLNLNASIAIGGAPAEQQPLAVQQAWAARLAQRGLDGGVQTTCAQMRAVLVKAEKEASFIYVYCHGSAPDPLGGLDESLLLAAGCKMEPRDLRERPAYRGAPIVFLNACKAGVSSPLTFASFLKEFRQRGALGMIGTSFSVPIAFAASFGEEVVEAYLGRKGSLAAEMLRLRRLHLLERGDPVPLFYTLQCHLDAPAPAR